jgi:DNA-binding MarR family transcriptional regulator
LSCHPGCCPLSQAQLSDRTGLDRSDVVRLVDDLTAQGFAERITDPDDRRRNIITVTGAGQAQLIALLQRILGA